MQIECLKARDAQRRQCYNAKYGSRHWVVWLVSSTKPCDHELPLPRLCGEYRAGQLVAAETFKTFADADYFCRELATQNRQWCKYTVQKIHMPVPSGLIL